MHFLSPELGFPLVGGVEAMTGARLMQCAFVISVVAASEVAVMHGSHSLLVWKLHCCCEKKMEHSSRCCCCIMVGCVNVV